MGRIRIVDAARGKAFVGLLVLWSCLLSSCTYAEEEPGLFGRPPAPTTVAPPIPTAEQTSAPAPAPNPDLPVVGDAVWTSGDGLDIQVRIAVHAIRRIAGATVLDWSVTPLSGPGLEFEDAVPSSLNLGLSRFGEGNANVFLIDARSRKVYRPLTRERAGGLQTCLCSPIWLAQRHLRIGQTQLLQIAYPELPADLSTIDVDVATVPLFWHVPVTPEGMVPQATNPTDLTRSPDVLAVASSSPVFGYGIRQQRFIVSVDAVIASSTFTSLQWTIQSLTEGEGLESATQPPFADNDLEPEKNFNPIAASGPSLRSADDPSSEPLRARLMTTKLRGLGAFECLCSDLRLWAAAMRSPQELVSVITNLPPLPNDTFTVDVILPGVTTLKDVRLVRASDATARSAGPVKTQSRTWTYEEEVCAPSCLATDNPPSGWSVDKWPTPLPRSQQVGNYRATVDDLVR